MKKTPSKVAQNFFFSTGLAAQTAQKQEFRTTKSLLMQDWVFRLGLKQENQFFKKERNPVSYIHRGCKLIMKFQGKQGIPTLGSKELKQNADSWDPNGFRVEAKIGYQLFIKTVQNNFCKLR